MDEEAKCQEPGCIERCWPGRDPDIVCVLHAEDSKKVADAMGFHLPMRPVGGINACACSKGRPQAVTIR